VAVDDVDGTLHPRLDPKPDAAYLIGTDGTVLFRSLWANHPGPLRQALSAVASGHDGPLGQNEGKAEALLRGTGKMWETLSAAGPVALRDVAGQVPPMWVFGPTGTYLPGLAATGQRRPRHDAAACCCAGRSMGMAPTAPQIAVWPIVAASAVRRSCHRRVREADVVFSMSEATSPPTLSEPSTLPAGRPVPRGGEDRT
jgi:hypothetical protein